MKCAAIWSNVTAVTFVCLLPFSFAFGQVLSHVDAIDQQLSLASQRNIASSGQLIIDPDTNPVLEYIADRISHTSYFANYPFPTQVSYLQDPNGGAFSTGAGQVYITSGLVQSMQKNEGVLAFAIGHEMAHNRLQHLARDRLRRIEYEAEYRRLRAQDARAALVYQIAWWVAEKKIERDEEHAADHLGLVAAAEAGYHPDYAILGIRALRMQHPDASRFATFLMYNHPRWVTREEHAQKDYETALATFERNWPNIEKSPGGIPPTLALVSPVRVAKTRTGIQTSADVQVHNLRSQTALLTARIVAEDGSSQVAFSRRYLADQTAPDPIAFDISKDQVRSPKKSVLLVQVTAGNNTLYDSGPIKLGSSHKVKIGTKSVATSTSHSAQEAIDEAAIRNPVYDSGGSYPKEQDRTVGSQPVDSVVLSHVPQNRADETSGKRSIGQDTVPSAVLEAAQQTRMCEVEITSNPPGATVEVSGIQVGQTPVTIRLRPSALGFNIHVVKDGYPPWYVQTFAVAGRQNFDVDLGANSP